MELKTILFNMFEDASQESGKSLFVNNKLQYVCPSVRTLLIINYLFFNFYSKLLKLSTELPPLVCTIFYQAKDRVKYSYLPTIVFQQYLF